MLHQMKLWLAVLEVFFCSQSQTECCAMLYEHCLQNNDTFVNMMFSRDQAANVIFVGIKAPKTLTTIS